MSYYISLELLITLEVWVPFTLKFLRKLNVTSTQVLYNEHTIVLKNQKWSV